MLRWLTAGESHGPMLVATIEGVPAGLALDEASIASELARRQRGFGRGGRMKIESDAARIVAGVRHGRTLGSPIALLIENKDHANWTTRMSVAPLESGQNPGPVVSLPRPGHADLAGAIKYRARDLRDVLERASARETAARVALGAIAKTLLAALDVRIGSHVRSIGSAQATGALELVPESRFDASLLSARADESEVRTADAEASPRMVEAIREAQRRRDTVGGTFEVLVSGLPAGVGSHVHWDRRLDARLVRAVTSIHAVKAAEVGDGWSAAQAFGSEVHDPILSHGPALGRGSDHAGGTEGGMSNGGVIVVRGAMKPIATLPNALPSVDLATGLADRAHVERSDTCAVPAAAVVAESMVALTIAEALLETWGADTLEDLREQVRRAWRRSRRLGGHLFLCGLSGSGKSTVGPRVAEAMGRPFVDLDGEVERAAGRTARQLFTEEGEASFRRREVESLRAAISSAPAVISLGGGTIVSAEARDLVRRSGALVRLKAPVPELARRIGADRSRPLLGDDPGAALDGLERDRSHVHAMCVEAEVEADAVLSAVVQRVLGAFGALR